MFVKLNLMLWWKPLKHKFWLSCSLEWNTIHFEIQTRCETQAQLHLLMAMNRLQSGQCFQLHKGTIGASYLLSAELHYVQRRLAYGRRSTGPRVSWLAPNKPDGSQRVSLTSLDFTVSSIPESKRLDYISSNILRYKILWQWLNTRCAYALVLGAVPHAAASLQMRRRRSGWEGKKLPWGKRPEFTSCLCSSRPMIS